MKILKDAAIVVAAVTLAVVTAGVAAGGSAAFAFGALASSTIGALGVSAGVASAILGGVVAIGATAILGAILPHPSQGGSQTKWKADPYAGLPYVMGRTLVSGNIVGKRGSGGKNTYEHFVTVLSVAGPIHAIEANFANRTTISFGSDGNASGTYNNRIWQKQQLGRCPEPAAMTPGAGVFPDWSNTTSKLSGLAATLTTFQYDAKGKTTFTTEPQMANILQGVMVYDPRLDSTYPGGSGNCRVFDETTYVYSEDPHLHGLTFALGRYANGKRVIGIGIGSAVIGQTVASVDIASFVEGANLNDARGWKIGGQIVSRPDTPWSNLKSVLQAGGAQPTLVGGVISCLNRAPRVSLATITAGEIAGDCDFSGTQPRQTRINGVIPMYRSEAHDWEYVSAAGVIVPAYVTLDRDERTKEIQYSLVQDVNQASQLARYDIEDSREAGPGTVPLKPWWLNYRIGDCVTFNPEDGFLIKALVMGRALDAQTGIVTYTIRSETDAKHAFALGQTGVAPPTASIAYDTSVDAPLASAWTITGATLSSTGGSIPAIEVDGAVDNASASQAIFELRLHVDGQDDDAGWETVSTDDPSTTRKVFGTVTPGTAYDVSIRYTVRGVTGDRLILGPAIAGQLSTPGALQAAVFSSFIVEVSQGVQVVTFNASGSITITDHHRRYPDGHADVAVSGTTIAAGLSSGDTRSIGYEDPGRLGGAVAYTVYVNDVDAHNSAADPGRHYMGYGTVPATGSAGGGGGGASGGRPYGHVNSA